MTPVRVAGAPAEVVATLAGLARRGRSPRRPSSSRRPGRPGAPKRVLLSRRAVLASVAATAAGSAARAGGCWRCPPTYVAGVQVVVRSLVAGHEPVLLDERLVAAAARTALASSRWCRPSCTGCSTTRPRSRRWPRCTPCCSAAARSTRRCARRAEAAGVRVVATYGSAETAGGCVYDGVRARRRRRWRSARTAGSGSAGRPCSTGTTATRRDRRGPGRRLVPDLRRRPARRGRPAARARPGRRRGGQRRRERARARGRRPAARAPRRRARPRWSAYPTRSGATGWSPSWSATLGLDDARATGWPRRTRAPGRRARWSLSTRSRCSPTARSTGCAAGAGREGVTHEGLVDPDADPLPRHHRPRGGAARGRRRAGGSGARSWSTRPTSPSPGCAAPRRRRPATGPRRCATSVPVNVTVPAVDPERAHEIVRAGGCRPPRSRSPSPARPSPTTRPGSRRCATRSGPAGRIRVDANGGWDVDERGRRDPARWTARPAAWSTSSSRARRVEELAAVRRRGRRADRRRRVDPPRRGPLPRPRPRGGRRRGAQGAAARRGARLPADRRGHRAARSWCRRRWRRASASRPGSRSPPRCPSCPTRAGWRPCSCSPTTWSREPLLPVDGALPVGAAGGRPGGPGPAGRAAGAGRGLGGPAGRGPRRCGRIAARDAPPSTELARAVVDALVEAGVTRGRAGARARATRRWRSRRTTPPRPGCCGCTPGSTSAPPASSRSACTQVAAPRRRRVHLRHRRRQPAPRRARGRPRRRAAGRVTADRPGPAARHRRQPDHRPGRHLRAAAWSVDPPTVADAAELPAACSARGPRLHLNVQLDEPLVPDDRWAPGRRPPGEPTAAGAPGGPRACSPLGPAHRRGRGRRRRAAGAGAGRAGRLAAARRAHQRVAHRRPTPMRCYRLLLDGDLGRPGRAGRRLRPPDAVASGDPAARPRRRRGARRRAPPGVWAERPFPVADRFASGRPAVDAPDDPAWLEEWRAADRSVSRRLDALLAAEPDLTPHEVAGRGQPRRCPPSGLLVVGASSPIRDLDLMVRAVRRRRPAQGDRQPRPVRHRRHRLDRDRRRPRPARQQPRPRADGRRDVPARRRTGWCSAPTRPRPDLTIVVVNDDGGSIFAMLEQGAPAYADRYDRLFGTPTASTSPASARPPAPPTGRSGRCPSSSRRWPRPTAASRSSRCAVRRDNRRDLDERIRALRP